MSVWIFERQSGEIKKCYHEKDLSQKISHSLNNNFDIFKNDSFVTEEIREFAKKKNIKIPNEHYKLTFFKSFDNYKKSLYRIFIFEETFLQKIKSSLQSHVGSDHPIKIDS